MAFDCTGCKKTFEGLDFMECCRCKNKYHYACINYTLRKFSNLSNTVKANWICPSCRCNEPKSCGNSITPVRPSTAASKSDCENITQRSKASRSATQCTCISSESIREIIREELRDALNSQLVEIRTQIGTFEQSITFLSGEYDKLKKECDLRSNHIIALQKDTDMLRTSNNELLVRLRQVEQQSRSSNIEINCVPEHKTEKLLNIVQHLGKIVKCPVREEDIHYCSRIAKLNNNNPRPRSILVRFSSPRLRDTFLAASISFNKANPKDRLCSAHLGIADDKRSPMYVVENLTPENKALHAAARIKAKELNYKFIWVRDVGKFFLRKSHDSKFILVKDRLILDSLK